AVDTATEEAILDRLRGVRQSRACLIVSHRVSTVRDADEILVLRAGRVAERGTHDHLVAAGGIYADMHRRQLLEEEMKQWGNEAMPELLIEGGLAPLGASRGLSPALRSKRSAR